MVTCSVIDCGTTQRNNPEKCTFHRFPIDLDRRNVWLRLINRPNWTPKKNSCICTKHFEEKYVQVRGTKRVLIKSALPTKFVPIKIKPRRTVSSYVYRDIAPETYTCNPTSSHARSTPPPLPALKSSSPTTHSQLDLTPRKLLSKCTKLHDKIKKKQQVIRNLRAQNKRIKNRVISLESLLDEMQKCIMKDHINDICAACSNTTLHSLIDRANAIKQGDISQSTTI